jgi:hypothetical protein
VATMTFASASQQRPTKPSWHRLVTAASSSVKAGDSDGDERLVLSVRNTTETDIDNPPQGFSPGDAVVAASDLYWRGKKVGYEDVHAVFTSVSETEVRAETTLTATVRGDEISVVGSVTFREEGAVDFELSVVGGTGRYDDVGGELTVVEQGQNFKYVFDLEHLD